jgi:hypothetical protein
MVSRKTVWVDMKLFWIFSCIAMRISGEHVEANHFPFITEGKDKAEATTYALGKTLMQYNPSDDWVSHQVTPLEISPKWLVDALTDEQRLELFSNYCFHCGSKNLPCQCQTR